MKKTLEERIDKFLVEYLEDKLDEAILEPSDSGIKPGEYNNLSTGLRRIQFRLEKANTPQKYVDAFEVVTQLINRFPLKSKIIWQTVASSYNIRFGATTGVAQSGADDDNWAA